MDAQSLIEKARPYLPGLPPEVEVLPWEGIEDPRFLGLAHRDRPALRLRPDLKGEDWERVLLHELLHLAEPLLSEAWVRVLEPVLHYALKAGLPPRDVPSLAWLSLEEAQARLLQDLPPIEGEEARFFPGPLGPFWRALGVIPDPDLAEDPLYLFVQVAGGLPYGLTVWALERLWVSPPLTRREAALRVAWRAALALEEEWKKVEKLLGRGEESLLPETQSVHLGQLWWVPVPEERRSLTLSLVDAVLEGKGEAYHPPEEGLPEEVVAGMLASQSV